MKKGQDFRLYGIFGYPLSHTLSPGMQEAAFRAFGINAHYIVLELVPGLFKEFMGSFSSQKGPISGFNVTVPYKEIVMKYLHKISQEARAIGAVNTVYRCGDQWAGANTDLEGFLMTLTRDGGFHPKGKKAVVLGAGGAARAVVYGLSKKGIRQILLTDFFPEKARGMVRDMRKIFRNTRYKAVSSDAWEIKDAVREADVIIHATPLGLKPKDPTAIPGSWIPKAGADKKLFMDLIYNPAMTPFLKMGKAKGHKILNGLGMLLYQGARAFEYWTRKKAPVGVMRRALLEALQKTGK